jgi:hypothetical protein
MFNWFKSKKKENDTFKSDAGIADLQKGDVFDYFMQTWEVKAVYEYAWGNDYRTKEYQIDNGTEKRYLEIDDDDELELALYEKVKIKALGLKDHLLQYNEPPKTFEYKGTKYSLVEKAEGRFRDITKTSEYQNWETFTSYEFSYESEEYRIGIEDWGGHEFEAAHGKIVNAFEFSNIYAK